MMKYRIPFNKPFVVGKELYYIAQAVIEGHTAGAGFFTQKCQGLLEEKFGAQRVLLTHSCTAALEMAALLCDVKPEDEVILPSFTFVSTANAFFLRGAKLVFVDIRPDTLNLDEQKIEAALSERSKVVVPVHYAGVACDMDAISEIAKSHHMYVVEDAAQGVNKKFRKQYLGTIGDLGTFSFHETKNIISGEGGALVINNDSMLDRAEIIWEKGTNRRQFFRGEIDKYTWVDIGSSYLPSEIIAAFLYAQLEHMDAIDQKRQQIFDYYYELLTPLAQTGAIQLPHRSDESICQSHIFYLILQNAQIRNRLMDYLKSKGILAVFHYLPLHLSPVGRSFGYRSGQLPVSETIAERLLRLPFYYDLTRQNQEEIADRISEFFQQ